MTYSNALIEPGPRLNLVLGPNGTGKSSLVCAICIGLAGGQKLLGRAEDVSSFVRRGCDFGEVEITLSNGETEAGEINALIRIKRRITVQNNSSLWWIDGREVRMKDVVDKVKSLNIQLDNLCQFLPQDKVVSFAQLRPVELLRATERAIGDAELDAIHTDLIRERSSLRDLERDISSKRNALGRLEEENERNERTVAQIRRRDEILAEIVDRSRKVPWLKYKEANDDYEEEKKKLLTAKDQLDKKKRMSIGDDGPMKRKKEDLDRVIKKLAESKEAANRAGRELDETNDAIEKTNVDIDKRLERIAGLEKSAQELQDRRRGLEGQIQNLKDRIESLPETLNENPPEKKKLVALLQDLNVQSQTAHEKYTDADTELERLETEQRMLNKRVQDLNDASLMKLRLLEQKSTGISRAVEWLAVNKGKFRGEVVGPVALEINPKDMRYADYIEQAIPIAGMLTFVTEYDEDQDLLSEELKKWCMYDPIVSRFGGRRDDPLSRKCGSATSYAAFGVTSTLDDCFSAPMLVKHFLDQYYMIGSHLVGNESTKHRIDAVYSAARHPHEVVTVWTPDARYDRKRSKYNANAISTMVVPIKGAQVLSDQTNFEENQMKRQTIESDLKKKEDEIVAAKNAILEAKKFKDMVTSRCSKVREELDDLSRRMSQPLQERKQLMREARIKEKELERYSSKPDPCLGIPKLQEEVNNLRNNALGHVKHMWKAYEKSVTATVMFIEDSLAEAEVKQQYKIMTAAFDSDKKELSRFEALVLSYEKNVKKMQEDARRLKQSAESAAPLTSELNEKFLRYPNTLDALLTDIQHRQIEADAIIISDPAAMAAYQRRCDEIQSLRNQVTVLDDQAQGFREHIEEWKGRWLPELRRIVSIVNETFSFNFARVGCAGEVALKEAEGDDFAEYAIEIRVKFRDNEALATLDASRQSGGERSVSTILYLIALQNVTITPFRVVDEINQGMDAVNERKVFKQLVEAATMPGTPQCFLLTPKLLPDLPFNKDVTVLQIMNGPHIKEVASSFTMATLLGPKYLTASA